MKEAIAPHSRNQNHTSPTQGLFYWRIMTNYTLRHDIRSPLLQQLSWQCHVNHLLGSPDRFHTWLKTLPEGAIAGTCGDTASCPIAQFLHQHIKTRVVYVERDEISTLLWMGDRASIPTPLWVLHFIHRVDELPRGTDVEGAIALSILESQVPWD